MKLKKQSTFIDDIDIGWSKQFHQKSCDSEAQLCANAHTNTATTKRETSVAVGRISAMHAMKRSSYRL